MLASGGGSGLWKLSKWEWLPSVLGKVAKEMGSKKERFKSTEIFRISENSCLRISVYRSPE